MTFSAVVYFTLILMTLLIGNSTINIQAFDTRHLWNRTGPISTAAAAEVKDGKTQFSTANSDRSSHHREDLYHI